MSLLFERCTLLRNVIMLIGCFRLVELYYVQSIVTSRFWIEVKLNAGLEKRYRNSISGFATVYAKMFLSLSCFDHMF